MSPAGVPEPEAASPPVSVEVVREVDPEEWPHAQRDCLEEFGFSASVLPDGGVEYESVNPEQVEALQETIQRCRAMFPVEEKYRRPLDEDQLSRLYRWYVAELIPCLEERGYGGFAPPSEAAFVETYYEDPWSPYVDLGAELDALGEREWYALQAACPQGPPLDLLYSDER